MDRPAVGWWCKTASLHVASVRIRAALVMRGLAAQGVNASWFDPGRRERYRAVVLSRRYDDATVEQARRLRDDGCRIVLDLCDNNFVPASSSQEHLRKVENLRSLAGLADAITVSAAPLGRIVEQECPSACAPMAIGDLADDLSIVPLTWSRRLPIELKRRREIRWLERHAGGNVARLIWFGNSGGMRQRSGLQDLAALIPTLELLHRERPLHLTVISNSRERYEEIVTGHVFSSRYVSWDPWTVDDLLARQHVTLIPAADNGYTDCKSDNRLVTSLRAGVAVVADRVPSYLPYAGTVFLGDFDGGLRTYLADPARRHADVVAGRQIADTLGAPGVILAQWRNVLGV